MVVARRKLYFIAPAELARTHPRTMPCWANGVGLGETSHCQVARSTLLVKLYHLSAPDPAGCVDPRTRAIKVQANKVVFRALADFITGDMASWRGRPAANLRGNPPCALLRWHGDGCSPVHLGFWKATLPKISRLERCPDRPLCRGLGQGNHFAGFSQGRIFLGREIFLAGCPAREDPAVFRRFFTPVGGVRGERPTKGAPQAKNCQFVTKP